MLHLRWQGGACEDIPVSLPPRFCDQLRYSKEIVDKVRNLAMTLSDHQIVENLNHEGVLSATGKPFNASKVRWIRFKHDIPAPELKRADEVTVKEAAQKFGVSIGVVYYWIERSVVQTRRIDRGFPYWIKLDAHKEKELFEWVCNSPRIVVKSV